MYFGSQVQKLLSIMAGRIQQSKTSRIMKDKRQRKRENLYLPPTSTTLMHPEPSLWAAAVLAKEGGWVRSLSVTALSSCAHQHTQICFPDIQGA